MSVWLVILGLVLVLVALGDALWTTLWPDGAAGPITSWWTKWHWRAGFRFASSHDAFDKLLGVAGPVVLVSTFALWVALMVAGWVLVFSSEPALLRDSRTHAPADLVGRIWFVVYTIFGLGNGDYTPYGSASQLGSAAMLVGGAFLVTLSVTYLLSVVSAVATKRALAAQISGIGRSAEEFVCRSWDGQGFGGLGVEEEYGGPQDVMKAYGEVR